MGLFVADRTIQQPIRLGWRCF